MAHSDGRRRYGDSPRTPTTPTMEQLLQGDFVPLSLKKKCVHTYMGYDTFIMSLLFTLSLIKRVTCLSSLCIESVLI